MVREASRNYIGDGWIEDWGLVSASELSEGDDGFVNSDFSTSIVGGGEISSKIQETTHSLVKNLLELGYTGKGETISLFQNGIRFKITNSLICFSVENSSYIIPYEVYERNGKIHIGVFSDNSHIKNNLKGVDIDYESALEKFIALISSSFKKQGILGDYIRHKSYGDIKLGEIDENGAVKKREIYIGGIKYILNEDIDGLTIRPSLKNMMQLPDAFEYLPSIKNFLNYCANKLGIIMRLNKIKIEDDIDIYNEVSQQVQKWDNGCKLTPETISQNQELWRNWGFMYYYITTWNKK